MSPVLLNHSLMSFVKWMWSLVRRTTWMSSGCGTAKARPLGAQTLSTTVHVEQGSQIEVLIDCDCDIDCVRVKRLFGLAHMSANRLSRSQGVPKSVGVSKHA